MRSRTVARVASQVASVKLVAIGDTYIDHLLVDRDLDYTVVTQDNQAMQILHDFAPDVTILDLVHLDKIDFQVIQQSGMTVSLSPIFNHLSETDLLFHRTSILGDDWPIDTTKCLIRSGLEYTVVNKHCQRIPDATFQRNLGAGALSIAISMGGTDAANKTLQVLDALREVTGELLLWVLLGEGYVHSYQDLVDSMQGSKHEIILAKTNDSMWRILSMCSLVILAGGITTYEAACAGLPSINTLETKDHFFLIQELVEKEVCLCAGHTFAESLSALSSIVSHLNTNRHELFAMRQASTRLIDGLGAKRIVQEIQAHYESDCQ